MKGPESASITRLTAAQYASLASKYARSPLVSQMSAISAHRNRRAPHRLALRATIRHL